MDEAPPRLERANWARQSYLDQMDSHKLKNASRHISKLNMGETKDDIHVCIMCLRAIMNNKVSEKTTNTALGRQYVLGKFLVLFINSSGLISHNIVVNLSFF